MSEPSSSAACPKCGGDDPACVRCQRRAKTERLRRRGSAPSSSAAPLTTAERNAQEAVREQGLCGAIGNGRVCIRDPHRGPHGFETMPEPDTAATAMTVIREALAAPHLQDDPASAALTPQERLENRASVIYWALFDAGLLTEAKP